MWNARSQLTATSGDASPSFVYDGVGRRQARTVNGTTVNFLYDGVNGVQELVGGTPRANMLTGGIDETFLRADVAGSWTFVPDALGSTLALTDGSGTLSTQYTYEPFGSTSASGPGSSNAAQYAERENDGTGLYYYRARYYSPAVQRFISEDPIGLAGGANLFTYAANAPALYGDPLGLDPTPGCSGPNGAPGGRGRAPPSPSPPNGCQPAPTGSVPAWSGNATASLAGVGALIGGLFGAVPGAIVGFGIGSEFGLGLNVSAIPSTHQWFVGPTSHPAFLADLGSV